MNRKYRRLFAEWFTLVGLVFGLIPAGVLGISFGIAYLVAAPLDVEFWFKTIAMAVAVPIPLVYILKEDLAIPYYKKRPRFRHGYVLKDGLELWYVEEQRGRHWDEVKVGLPDQESAVAFIDEQYRVWTEEYGEHPRLLGTKVFQ